MCKQSHSSVLLSLCYVLYLLPGKRCGHEESSHWWRSGDGKIISVAEEGGKKKKKSFLSLRIQTNTLGLNPKTMLIKARKHLETLPTKMSIYIFSEIAAKDKAAFLHRREHLEYQRFRV